MQGFYARRDNCDKCQWSGNKLLYLENGQGVCPVCYAEFKGCINNQSNIPDAKREDMRVHRLPITPILLLTVGNSPIAFVVEGRENQQYITIYTNNIERFEKDVDISQSAKYTTVAMNIPQNPKFNITNYGVVQGQVIGDHQKIIQHFNGDVMRQEIYQGSTTNLKVTIVVPENIDVIIRGGINVTIKGVKGEIKR